MKDQESRAKVRVIFASPKALSNFSAWPLASHFWQLNFAALRVLSAQIVRASASLCVMLIAHPLPTASGSLAGRSTSDGAVHAENKAMTSIDFRLRDEFIQLDQLLKVTGMANSGGAAHALIVKGMVEVDGLVELRKRAKLRAGQRVRFAGQEVLLTPAATGSPTTQVATTRDQRRDLPE